jgi:hypothetical protein
LDLAGVITPACNLAIDEFKRTSANVRRFWNLIYAVSAASAVMLVVFVVTIAFSDRLAAIVPGVGSVMGGAGLAALVKLKNSAYAELGKARAAVRADCKISTARSVELSANDIDDVLSALVD